MQGWAIYGATNRPYSEWSRLSEPVPREQKRRLFCRAAGTNWIVKVAGPVVAVVPVLPGIRILGSDGTGCAKFDGWGRIGERLEPAGTAAVSGTGTLNFLQSHRAASMSHRSWRHA